MQGCVCVRLSSGGGGRGPDEFWFRSLMARGNSNIFLLIWVSLCLFFSNLSIIRNERLMHHYFRSSSSLRNTSLQMCFATYNNVIIQNSFLSFTASFFQVVHLQVFWIQQSEVSGQWQRRGTSSPDSVWTKPGVQTRSSSSVDGFHKPKYLFQSRSCELC